MLVHQTAAGSIHLRSLEENEALITHTGGKAVTVKISSASLFQRMRTPGRMLMRHASASAQAKASAK